MYIIYVSNTINVNVLAAQWGQDHEKLPNGTLQAVHSVLRGSNWKDSIRDKGRVTMNPRVVHLSQATPDDIPAIELTGMMHDGTFQIIAYMEDDKVAQLSAIQTEAQIVVVDQILDIMRENMMESIAMNGVMDNITWQQNKILYSFGKRPAAQAAREAYLKRTEYIHEYIANAPESKDAVVIIGA